MRYVSPRDLFSLHLAIRRRRRGREFMRHRHDSRGSISVNARGNVISGVNIARYRVARVTRSANNRGGPIYTAGRTSRKSLSTTLSATDHLRGPRQPESALSGREVTYARLLSPRIYPGRSENAGRFYYRGCESSRATSPLLLLLLLFILLLQVRPTFANREHHRDCR